MLDDNDGVAAIYQTVQQLHDLLNIGSVETGRGFVQYIDIAFLVQIFCQLHPLALTSGEGREGLTQRQVGQTYFNHCPQSLAQLPVVLEKLVGFPGGHVQNLHDVLFLIPIG